MKTPNPNHPIRNALKHLALGVAAAAAFFTTGPTAKANVTYDFSTGLQGWTQIYPTSGALWSADFGWPVSSSLGHLGAGWDAADTQMGRSPEFKLNGTGDLTFQTFGSLSPLAAVGVIPSTVPATAIVGGGFCGLALRDVAANAYVLSKGQSAHNYTSPAGFTTLSFTASELEPYFGDGKMYTLDWIDYDKQGTGGWGWLVNVSIPTLKADCDITAFGINVAGSSAVIATTSATEGTVEWTVPFGTTVGLLAPTYTLSSGASCLPASGSSQNFNSSVHYIVTAEDGTTTKDYAVTVIEGPASSDCDITAFGTNVAGSSVVITTVDFSTSTLVWTVPIGTNVATLAPTYSLSVGATCPRTSGTIPTPALSTTTPVPYLVNAQDTFTSKTYDVTVRIASSLVWNVAGGGDWDFATPNWNLPDTTPTTFANGDEVTFNNTAGGTISIPASVSPLSTTVSAASGTYTFSGGPIATGSLTKDGAGTLRMAKANSYDGGTIIQNGTLLLEWPGDGVSHTTLGSGSVTLDGGTLLLSRTDLANALIVNGGTLISENGFGNAFSGTITLNSTLSCNVAYTLNCSGAISGPGGLTKNNGGPMTLSGTNSYEGPTTVTGGTLKCDIVGALPGGALSISSGGAKVDLNFAGTKSIASLTLAGVEQTTAGTYGSATSAAIFKSGYFSGAGMVQVGDPAFAAAITSFGTNVPGSAAVIDPVVGGAADITWYVPFGTTLASLAPTFVMTAGSTCSNRTSGVVPIPGFDAGSVNYTIVSQNTLTTNVYTVTVTVLPDESTLIWNLSSGGAWNFITSNWRGETSGLPTPYFDGVNVIFNDTVGGTIALNGNLSPLSTSVNATSGTYVFGVTVDGGAITTGSLTKDGGGTLQMAKANSYAGGTTIANGTLRLEWPGDGVSHTTLGSGIVTLNGGTLLLSRTDLANALIVNGGTLISENGFGNNYSGPITLNSTLSCNVAYTLNCSGAISGPGGLTKNNGGPMTLSGTNSYEGPTTVTGGTLRCDSPGSLGGGALSISSMVNLNYAGTKTVASLILGGVAQTTPGTYGSVASGADFQSDTYFAGSGTVTVSGSSGFAGWAAANAPGQTPGEDYDNDGVDNGIEYFMGQTGSSFTTMPSLDGTNTVAWTMNPAYAGTYEVQTSPDLGTWTNVDPKPVPSGGTLSYTLPPGLGKQFVRLLVTPMP